jgi:hypothetical protein
VVATGESSNRYWALETDDNGHDRLMMFWRESGKPENIVIPDLTIEELDALAQVLYFHRMFNATNRQVITHIVRDDGGTRS